jgi:hypothetical protein
MLAMLIFFVRTTAPSRLTGALSQENPERGSFLRKLRKSVTRITGQSWFAAINWYPVLVDTSQKPLKGALPKCQKVKPLFFIAPPVFATV